MMKTTAKALALAALGAQRTCHAPARPPPRPHRERCAVARHVHPLRSPSAGAPETGVRKPPRAPPRPRDIPRHMAAARAAPASASRAALPVANHSCVHLCSGRGLRRLRSCWRQVDDLWHLRRDERRQHRLRDVPWHLPGRLRRDLVSSASSSSSLAPRLPSPLR